MSAATFPDFLTIKFMIMQRSNDENATTCALCGSPVEQSILDILDSFFLITKSKFANRYLRQLFVVAMSSDESEQWTPEYRADLCFLYKEISELIEDLEPVYESLLNALSREEVKLPSDPPLSIEA